MKHILALQLTLFLFTFTVVAQKIAKPTLSPKPPTAEQNALIKEGVALHDAGKYDEAIAKYEKVISDNPDCTAALYELSMTLYAKGDKEKAMETAYRGSKYNSDELSLFYVTMANVLDDYGKPDEAVKIYADGIKLLEGKAEFARARASLYYNMGVTYVKQKKYPDARQALKSAVQNDCSYPSPHYLLSEVYIATQYKIPALLAASRFIALEYNTQRTTRAAGIFGSVFKPAAKDEKTGNIQIFVNMNAPKDEGDFAMYDLFLGTLTTLKDEKDKDKTEEEKFADAFDTVCSLVLEDKNLRSTFVGKTYVPFIAEMKQKGLSRTMAYVVLYKAGNQKARPWLNDNKDKLAELVEWAKAYKPPAK